MVLTTAHAHAILQSMEETVFRVGVATRYDSLELLTHFDLNWTINNYSICVRVLGSSKNFLQLSKWHIFLYTLICAFLIWFGKCKVNVRHCSATEPSHHKWNTSSSQIDSPARVAVQTQLPFNCSADLTPLISRRPSVPMFWQNEKANYSFVMGLLPSIYTLLKIRTLASFPGHKSQNSFRRYYSIRQS